MRVGAAPARQGDNNLRVRAVGVEGRHLPESPRTMGSMDYWLAVTWSILPTIAVLVVGWFILRSILRFDRTERKAYARVEAEERAKRGLAPRDAEAAPRS